MQLTEPREENSGLMQGLFLKRHRVSNPDGGFYNLFDLVCGKDILLYSKLVHLVSVDEFTRKFYKDSNLDLGKESEFPCDQFTFAASRASAKDVPLTLELIRAKELVEVMCGGQPINRKYKQYLASDGKVLRFHCVWVDESVGGETHFYDLHYFLADDSIEMIETRARSESCAAERVLFLKRRLVPKNGQLAHRYSDSSDTNTHWTDLSIGGSVWIGNRKFDIQNADSFTRKWYLETHGIQLATLIVPEPIVDAVPNVIPPSIGFGSEEDSLVSCRMSLVPKQVRIERHAEFEGVCLRFNASVPDRREFKNRNFVVAFFPVDRSISVWEEPVRNSGIVGGKFSERARNSSLQWTDFAVGKSVKVAAVEFLLTGTDTFTKNWLLQHT